MALLPNAARGETGDRLDAALRTGLDACHFKVDRTRAGRKATALSKDVPVVEKALRTLESGDRLPWSDWARRSTPGCPPQVPDP